MIMPNTAINSFDRGKPFYPLIMNYLIFLCGVKEFTVSGLIKRAAIDFSKTDLMQIKYTRKLEYEFSSKIAEAIGPIPKDTKISDVLEMYTNKVFSPNAVPPVFLSLPKMAYELETDIAKLAAGPLQLTSKHQNMPIEIPLDLIEEETGSNYSYLLKFTMRAAAGNLLILAHEITRSYHDNTPLWEFLRHCRNAAAHNGNFRFSRDEPRRPAEWGPLHIEKSMQGTALFPIDEKTTGFLGAGDAIRLLWDIEQAYPNIQVS